MISKDGLLIYKRKFFIMNLKDNINKIHYSLTESFEKVTIKEKENISSGKYFQIEAFNENKQIKLQVTFKDLEQTTFKWKYSENPLNESSDWVERFSSIENFSSDISDIFSKNRFSDDYIKTIK